MKKILFLAIVIISAVFMSFSASAKNQVTNIDTELIINDDGSADIYQIWQCTFSQDTEVYYFLPDEGKYEISSFVVWDEDKTYETVSEWDVSQSFQQKAGKCGILEYKDGYELCWGITEYGEKTYYVYFRIDNLVTAYKDADAAYLCLFSENVDTRPTDISLKISLANGKKLTDGLFLDGEFTDSGNCDIRKTLYLYPCDFKGGKFIIKSDYPMTNVDCMAFSITFQKGLIDPVNTKSGSAEKSVNKYFNKYVDDSFWEILKELFTLSPDNEIAILFFALLIGIGIPLVIILLWKIFCYIFKKSIIKNPEVNRNVPSIGIEASYIMLNDFKLSSDKNLLTLIFLDMMDAGAITPIQPDAGDPIPVSKGNVKFRINPIENAEELDEAETKFHKFLTIAAKDDQILDPYEITVKSQDYFYTLRKIMDAYIEDGDKIIGLKQLKRKSEFLSEPFLYKPEGKDELRKVLGYKKYLTEYSAHNSVNVLDYDLWKEPMRYAIIFGETAKIKEEILKVYPSSNYDINEYSKNLLFAQQAAKLMAKGIAYSEKNYSRSGYHSSSRYGTYSRTTISTGGFRSGGGGFGGGGRSGGGTR